MNAYSDKLKETIEQLSIPNVEKKALLQLLGRIEKELEASVARLSKKCAEVSLAGTVSLLANLKMNLRDVDEKLSTRHFYGKVIKRTGKGGLTQSIRFTSVPPEVDAYFQAHLQYAAKGMSAEKT